MVHSTLREAIDHIVEPAVLQKLSFANKVNSTLRRCGSVVAPIVSILMELKADMNVAGSVDPTPAIAAAMSARSAIGTNALAARACGKRTRANTAYSFKGPRFLSRTKFYTVIPGQGHPLVPRKDLGVACWRPTQTPPDTISWQPPRLKFRSFRLD